MPIGRSRLSLTTTSKMRSLEARDVNRFTWDLTSEDLGHSMSDALCLYLALCYRTRPERGLRYRMILTCCRFDSRESAAWECAVVKMKKSLFIHEYKTESSATYGRTVPAEWLLAATWARSEDPIPKNQAERRRSRSSTEAQRDQDPVSTDQG
jgi:hypothetical protein